MSTFELFFNIYYFIGWSMWFYQFVVNIKKKRPIGTGFDLLVRAIGWGLLWPWLIYMIFKGEGRPKV